MELSDVLELAENEFDNSVYTVLTGSHVYGLNTEKSDFDVKIALVPSMEELVWEDVVKGSKVKVEGCIDMQYMPLAHMVRQGLNVKFPFIECWTSPYYATTNEFIVRIRSLFADYMPMDPISLLNSSRGMANQLWKSALNDEEKFNKRAGSAFYMMFFMLNYLDTGKISYRFDSSTKAMEVKLGLVEKQHVLTGWEGINSFANSILFTDPEQKRYSDYVKSKDKTKTKMFADLEREIEGLTVDICESLYA